jgi:type II secretory pathway pseudopilin PulG
VGCAEACIGWAFSPCVNGVDGKGKLPEETRLRGNATSKESSPTRHTTTPQSMRGFSLLEMTVVVLITMVVMAITFVTTQPLLKQAHVNSAYDTTMMALRNYRSRAITERRRYIVAFTGPQTITISTWGVGSPVAPAPVVVSTLNLPNDVQFMVQAGIPSTAATVPDGFGIGAVPIDFGQGLGVGSLNYVMFMPDGSSQDMSNPGGGSGNLNSGVIYLGRNNELLSMRAISVFGATGRIRGWRLLNGGGGPQWTQQ